MAGQHQKGEIERDDQNEFRPTSPVTIHVSITGLQPSTRASKRTKSRAEEQEPPPKRPLHHMATDPPPRTQGTQASNQWEKVITLLESMNGQLTTLKEQNKQVLENQEVIMNKLGEYQTQLGVLETHVAALQVFRREETMQATLQPQPSAPVPVVAATPKESTLRLYASYAGGLGLYK